MVYMEGCHIKKFVLSVAALNLFINPVLSKSFSYFHEFFLTYLKLFLAGQGLPSIPHGS